MLVTHDRYMLDRVSTIVLGLDGRRRSGKLCRLLAVGTLASRAETRGRPEEWLHPRPAAPRPRPSAKKKLSYLEAREYAGLEQRIAQAEESLRQKRANAEDPAIASDAERLLLAHSELQQAQKDVDALYERWAELEGKQ